MRSVRAYQVRAELTARIEQLSQGKSNTAAWIKALKYDLSAERAKREAADERLAAVIEDSKVPINSLNFIVIIIFSPSDDVQCMLLYFINIPPF